MRIDMIFEVSDVKELEGIGLDVDDVARQITFSVSRLLREGIRLLDGRTLQQYDVEVTFAKSEV